MIYFFNCLTDADTMEPNFKQHCLSSVFASVYRPLVAIRRGSGGGVSGSEDAAATGAGAAQCLSEQDQDANRCST